MHITVRPSLNLLALSFAWNRTTELDAYKEKGHFSLFLLEAMSRDPLPSFAYRGRKHPLQKSKGWYGSFSKDLKCVYREHRLEILNGAKHKPCKEEKVFSVQLKELIKTFGRYAAPCDAVVLTPNVYGVPGEGYGPLLGRTAYAIFTPDPKKDQTWLMIHEVCHSLLLPVFRSSKVRRLIARTAPLMKAWSTKKFRTYYPKWEWMIEEYMIHAIEQYVTGSSIKEKMSWGMNRLPWFVASWSKFQGRRKTDPDLSVGTWVEEALRTMEKRLR